MVVTNVTKVHSQHRDYQLCVISLLVHLLHQVIHFDVLRIFASWESVRSVRVARFQ